jgi:histidinol-phosphate aminotransferase
MAKYEELIPEHIRALGGYIPGKPLRQAEQESGVSCIKMASNENPFGPSPRALEAMRQAAPTAHLYPDNEVTELRSRLIGRFRVEPDQLLITGGSTAFLNVIARTLLGPGRKAVTGERSFIVYPIVTRATGAQFVTVPMREDAFDLEAVLAAVDRDTRVVFLANPNNPTGTLLPPAEIERFLDRLPAHVVAVLDEAYSDFAEHFAAAKGVPYSRSLEYVRAGRNVVVLRTFSKAHGLAGLRIGYGFAPAGLMQYFARMKTVFSVSALAEAAAVAALDDQAHIRLALENNAAGAKWLSERMAELGFRVVPTWGNFLYVDVGEDAAALAKRMEAAGVIIRPLTGAWGAPQAIRITIGTPDQNEKCISALKKVTARTVASG